MYKAEQHSPDPGVTMSSIQRESRASALAAVPSCATSVETSAMSKLLASGPQDRNHQWAPGGVVI